MIRIQYVHELNLLLPIWIQEGKQELSDPRSVWDWVKYKVKKYSRWYSINKCKQQNLQEQRLNRQFQEATETYQNCPSQENLSALNVLKEKLEHQYEKKVEGIESVFYKHFFDNNIIYTTHLLYEMTNIESFNAIIIIFL